MKEVGGILVGASCLFLRRSVRHPFHDSFNQDMMIKNLTLKYYKIYVKIKKRKPLLEHFFLPMAESRNILWVQIPRLPLSQPICTP
jgi:hypothetical protein